MARRHLPDIGIIFATGRIDVDEASSVENAIVIAKPYGETDIADAIDRLMARKPLH